MYADFVYYTEKYSGKLLKTAEDFNHYGRKAGRRIDVITGFKLQSAFPTNENHAEAVKDCFCELVEFLYQVDQYQTAAVESAGVVQQSDGTVKGKVITSISSGSESISYSAGGSVKSSIAAAAEDKGRADREIYRIVYDGLSMIPDDRGINLLYAGITDLV